MPVRPPISDGAVDTPAPLARELAERLFAETGPARVLDPACGTGELLVGALALAGGQAGFAAGSLFGIELRPERAARARERLLDALAPETPERERAEVAAVLEQHILCADALDPAVAWPAGTHVLANPPWMSLSGRHSVELEHERVEAYRRSWSVLRSGWPSIHGAFLERIAGHLASADGTRARVLIPTAVCELERYGPTRAAVRRHAHLDRAPRDLGEDLFAGVTQPTTLLALASGADSRSPEDSAWMVAAPSGSSGSKAGGAPSARELAVLARLEHCPRLPEKSFGDPGVHTGNSSRELVFRDEEQARAGGAAVEPVRVGRDLAPYRLGQPTQWLRTDLERTSARRFRLPPLERMRSFPILLRQTATHPIAALHTSPTYFRNSLLACRGVPGLDPAFLVAVLNSPLLALWHRRAHRDARQRSFPQVKVGHLAGLPFPFLSREAAPRLHDELAARVRELDRCEAERAERIARVEALVERAFGLTPSEGTA